MKHKRNLMKKLTASMITVVVLLSCLCMTTAALVAAAVSAENQFFRTGEVDINLNDGMPVIQAHEFLFEPGMTVKKEFFVENKSTWAVYYRLYFEDVAGGLADCLDVSIRAGEKILYAGSIQDLQRRNVQAADDQLQVGERRNLSIWFYFPPESGNEAEDLTLSFTLCAEAVQTKNNPEMLFD